MNEQPAGWYPDPFAAVPGATRYWDGERWTSNAQAPAPEPQPAQREHDGHGAGGARGFGAASPPAGHPEAQPWQRAAAQGWDQGADAQGQPPLASWGRRVGAYLLDCIPMIVLTMVLLQLLGVVDAMNAALASGDAAAIDEVNAMLSTLSPVGLAISAANLAFSAIYNIGFHVSRGATPGKMLVGIRVRRIDEDRNPELRGAGLRWLVQFGPNLLNSVPAIGFLSGVFSIADHLWPLWDPRNQAFHDKAGRTVVVRSR
ncbi:RDD family protein [Agrococcus sp. Marseille-P2731]|uniref:RDD family protein n=1 Tax=Agrococcus sp. Marseille-P2731 TaxID=1841862 RepID=UPI00093187BF|nr:RDD family protein [Agrococcus sp. Marseille-P2731]